MASPLFPHTPPTVADLLHAYRRDYLPRKSPKTQYQEGLLYEWMARELGSIPLAAFTPLVLRTWRDALSARYKPGTVRRYLTALSAVLTAAVDHYDWLPKHPMRHKGLKPLAPPDRERCLTAEECPRLLAACAVSRNRLLAPVVTLALSTATRKNELLQRRWTDIDLTRGLLSIPQSKNGTRRAIPLVPTALAVLQEQVTWQRVSPWVFPRADGRKPILLDYAWRQACKRAGLVDFHFHDLRHTSATYLALSGASIEEIREILGHKTVNQTRKYIHLIEPLTRAALHKMTATLLPSPEEG